MKGISISEQSVSLETAKLAIDKGMHFIRSLSKYDGEEWYNEKKEVIPLQSILQKALREEHNIQMVIKPFYNSLEHKGSFTCDVIRISDGKVIKSARYPSYEEALEKGLKNGLRLIN